MKCLALAFVFFAGACVAQEGWMEPPPVRVHPSDCDIRRVASSRRRRVLSTLVGSDLSNTCR